MKRTPLNRGTSQLKRTPMKKRRTRHRDTKESLAVRQKYRDANQVCEVTAFMRRAWDVATQVNRERITAWRVGIRCFGDNRPPQADHIWGGTSGRLDLHGMLLMASPQWHEWKTRNPTVGILLFLVVKANKNPSEINAEEFSQCSGMDLKGWLDLDKTIAACPSWLEKYRKKLLKSL